MIRWICSVKPHNEVPTETLYTKLGIQEVAVALRTKLLRWYGHVTCASSCKNSITGIAIPDPRGSGRPRKSWSECVKADVHVCNLEGFDPLNREAWRSGLKFIQLVFILRLKIKGNEWLLADTCRKAANHCALF